MKGLFILILLISGYVINAQKFMILEGDTLALKSEIEIFEGDTFYIEPCPRFEIVKGRMYNFRDSNCVQEGLWIDTINDVVLFRNYHNGLLNGISKKHFIDSTGVIYKDYYRNDTLLREELELYSGLTFSKVAYNYYSDSVICFDTLLYPSGAYKRIAKYKFPKKCEDIENPSTWTNYEVGTTTGWFENGNISYQRYNADPSSKMSIDYRESGIMLSMTFYRPDGYMQKEITFNPNGSIAKEENFIWTKSHYNTLHGVFRYYDENGYLIKTEVYRRGKLKKTR